MKFTKMHGCGNDYVYISGFDNDVKTEEKAGLVRRLSDRHFGIGGDGVIFVNPSQKADFEMEMYNADGSRGEMCGNGIRCVARFVYDHGLTDSREIAIESFGVEHRVFLESVEKDRFLVRVNMGAPILEAERIPVDPAAFGPGEDKASSRILNAPLFVDGKDWKVTCVSMGNPHAVVFVDDTASFPIETIGPRFESHPAFPKRTNTEFVQVLGPDRVRMRVWERGSGETLACGTGCCATAVACVLNGRTNDRITVEVLGGELEIFWDRERNEVWMTGPATAVFEGDIDV